MFHIIYLLTRVVRDILLDLDNVSPNTESHTYIAKTRDICMFIQQKLSHVFI